MEYHKTSNFLNEASDSKFVTRKQKIANNQSNRNYSVGNEIMNSTKVKFNLYDYNDTQILVRGNITIIEHNVTQASFKDYAPFIKCITKLIEQQKVILKTFGHADV